jgi:hypothetical protein
MQTRSDGNTKARDIVSDGTCTANTSCRSVKGGEKSVTCRINLFASKVIQFPTDEAVVTF